MALQMRVFGGWIQLEGVLVNRGPSMVIGDPPNQACFVISQQWFVKSNTATTVDHIKKFMEEQGFSFVPYGYFAWFRAADRVAVVDAKPDNFVTTGAGIIPIDLQLYQFSDEDAERLEIDDTGGGIIFG
jgi:hypothetical protein